MGMKLITKATGTALATVFGLAAALWKKGKRRGAVTVGEDTLLFLKDKVIHTARMWRLVSRPKMPVSALGLGNVVDPAEGPQLVHARLAVNAHQNGIAVYEIDEDGIWAPAQAVLYPAGKKVFSISPVTRWSTYGVSSDDGDTTYHYYASATKVLMVGVPPGWLAWADGSVPVDGPDFPFAAETPGYLVGDYDTKLRPCTLEKVNGTWQLTWHGLRDRIYDAASPRLVPDVLDGLVFGRDDSSSWTNIVWLADTGSWVRHQFTRPIYASDLTFGRAYGGVLCAGYQQSADNRVGSLTFYNPAVGGVTAHEEVVVDILIDGYRWIGMGIAAIFAIENYVINRYVCTPSGVVKTALGAMTQGQINETGTAYVPGSAEEYGPQKEFTRTYVSCYLRLDYSGVIAVDTSYSAVYGPGGLLHESNTGSSPLFHRTVTGSVVQTSLHGGASVPYKRGSDFTVTAVNFSGLIRADHVLYNLATGWMTTLFYNTSRLAVGARFAAAGNTAAVVYAHDATTTRSWHVRGTTVTALPALTGASDYAINYGFGPAISSDGRYFLTNSTETKKGAASTSYAQAKWRIFDADRLHPTTGLPIDIDENTRPFSLYNGWYNTRNTVRAYRPESEANDVLWLQVLALKYYPEFGKGEYPDLSVNGVRDALDWAKPGSFLVSTSAPYPVVLLERTGDNGSPLPPRLLNGRGTFQKSAVPFSGLL